jgi:hypothetical protein
MNKKQVTGRAAERSQLAIARHQDKLRQMDDLAGYLTISEAAAITKRTRQAIHHAIITGALPAKRGPSGREWWIHPVDLRTLFPGYLRNKPRPSIKSTPLTEQEREQRIGAHPIPAPGTPERAELIRRAHGSDE